MSYPLNSLGKAIFPGICAILPAVGVKGAPRLNYFHSSVSASHISVNSTLYKGDTVSYHPVTGFISHRKNGDLMISVPSALIGRYAIRFYDEEHYFLFEIRKIPDPMLIIEKSNFQHAGTFRYEIYQDYALVEKGSFVIKNDEVK
jgi:hypothetical protein